MSAFIKCQLDNFVSSKTKSNPLIYAYTDPHYPGLLKVGFTARSIPERMAEHYPTKSPAKPPYKIVFTESAMYEDGGTFTDHAVHTALRKKGIPNPDGEWFKCGVEDVRAHGLQVSPARRMGKIATRILPYVRSKKRL
ncbi:GIY-YIG nuclease family protein [Desulfovibrio sp. ZJ200]|uniref:GIY-YIG nuclease family protein n=1 Tax=Desulfovibrio sp. ZJ200 TaxID=2709792 RepID=UPI0013EB2741|nr:GIY-YIG nuclease family protein [Desulfovibrio sp. ZJ200]